MLLAPFLLLAARVKRVGTPGPPRLNSLLTTRVKRVTPADGAPDRTTVPGFALLFIIVTRIHSLHLAPAAAMAALGLTTRVSALKPAGIKPLLPGLLLFIWPFIGGGPITLLAQRTPG